ncbi:hypothetical protein NL523_28165, partial [Klebsiella pneumoniae]|nr:hypothetical protein [Klebsiella pneumoniae]MCP6663625.1 hypothetical protein [Klebsiella pneumoniae]
IFIRGGQINGHMPLDNGVNNEFAFGNFTIECYAWTLDNVRLIDPVSAKGMQRLWEWEGP